MNQAEVKRKQIQLYSYAACIVILLHFVPVLGSNGLAYFVTGYIGVAFFLQFVSGAASDAVGKMLRYRRKRGLYLNAFVVRKRMQIVLLAISSVSFFIMLLMADVLARNVLGVPNAELIIRILSPVLLLRMLVGYWQGYFQSFGSQLQTMLGCLLRPIFYFIFGKAFCYKNFEYGEKVSALLKNEDFGGMYAAAGLAGAIVLTELILFGVMLVFYFLSDRKSDKSKSGEGRQSLESWRESLGAFARLSGPGIGIGVLSFGYIATWFILLKDKTQIGVFGGMFLTLATLITLLIGARFYLIYAKTVHAIKGEHNRHIRDTIHTGVRYAWCYGIIGCMLMAVLAPQITQTFFYGNELVESVLQKGSLLLPFVILWAYWILVHMVYKNHLCIFISMVTNIALFALLAVFMKGRMADDMTAIMYAAIISLATVCVLLGVLAVNKYRLQLEYIITFILPLACVGLVGLVLMAASKLLTPHIGNEVCFYLCAALGYVLYLVLLAVCRVFAEQDVNLIYGKLGKKCLSFIFK